MMQTTQPSRRGFLKCTSGMALLSGMKMLEVVSAPHAQAREPIERSGPAEFRVGLAAYSLRPYFRYMKGKKQKNARQPPAKTGRPTSPMIMQDFLDYCVEVGVDACELTSYFLTPSDDGFPSDESLLKLNEEAEKRNLTISGTAIGNNFTVGVGDKLNAEMAAAKRWIAKAAILGAPHIRFFAGTAAQLASAPERLGEAVDSLHECAATAALHKIMLGVENHGGLDGDQMLEIMKRVESQWIGINLDTGNFLTEDPYRDLERCVPYSVNVQVKTSMKTPDGKHYEADLDRVGKILRDGGYQGFVVLEYEDKDPFDQIPRRLDELRKALGV